MKHILNVAIFIVNELKLRKIEEKSSDIALKIIRNLNLIARDAKMLLRAIEIVLKYGYDEDMVKQSRKYVVEMPEYGVILQQVNIEVIGNIYENSELMEGKK